MKLINGKLYEFFNEELNMKVKGILLYQDNHTATFFSDSEEITVLLENADAKEISEEDLQSIEVLNDLTNYYKNSTVIEKVEEEISRLLDKSSELMTKNHLMRLEMRKTLKYGLYREALDITQLSTKNEVIVDVFKNSEDYSKKEIEIIFTKEVKDESGLFTKEIPYDCDTKGDTAKNSSRVFSHIEITNQAMAKDLAGYKLTEEEVNKFINNSFKLPEEIKFKKITHSVHGEFLSPTVTAKCVLNLGYSDKNRTLSELQEFKINFFDFIKELDRYLN